MNSAVLYQAKLRTIYKENVHIYSDIMFYLSLSGKQTWQGIRIAWVIWLSKKMNPLAFVENRMYLCV